MRLLSFAILSFLVMVFSTSAVLLWVGFSPLDNVYWAALSTPIVWLSAMLYSYWDDKAWRAFGVLLLISLVSAWFVFISPVPDV